MSKRRTRYAYISLGESFQGKILIDVILENPHTGLRTKTKAIIDPGSDICAFPSYLAIYIGHKLLKGRTETVETVNGPTTAHTHTANILLHHLGKEIPISKNVKVDFIKKLKSPLLGVKGFLENSVILINYPRKRFLLRINHL